MSASTSQVSTSRALARRVVHRMPWLVDAYRLVRKPDWEYALWRDYERTRRATRSMRGVTSPLPATAPVALVALYRDDVFDTKIGLVLANALRPKGLRTVV